MAACVAAWLTLAVSVQDPSDEAFGLGPRTTTFGEGGTSAPLALDGGLPVELGPDLVVPMGFDTGQSPPLCVTRALVEELGLEPVGSVPVGDGSDGGALSMGLVPLPTVRLGGVSFDGVVALVLPDAGHLKADAVGGSVGFGLFRGGLLTLDQRAGTIAFEPGELPEPDGRSVVELDLTRTPAVELSIGGRAVRASIDSAWSAWLSLPLSMAGELALAEPLTPGGRARTLFNEMQLQRARLAGRVRLGRHDAWHPELEFNDLLDDVILGRHFLEEHAVTFDSARARVRFVPHVDKGGADASVASVEPQTRELSRASFRDRLSGSLHGQAFGLAWGFTRGIEFRYRRRTVPDDDFPDWRAVDPNLALDPQAGDDLFTELCALSSFGAAGLDARWSEIVPHYRDTELPLWHSDQRMRENLRRGLGAPACGHFSAQLDAAPWGHAEDLDAQMQADLFGALAPGDPEAAISLAWRFGHLVGYGDGVIGACVMAAMNAEAYVADHVDDIVQAGLRAAPRGTRYRELLDDVVSWHAARPGDWRACWRELDRKWGQDDRCPIGNGLGRMNDAAFNIDAKLHGGFVLMGLLFGAGDFVRSLEITIRCGQDTDTSAQNLGSILGAFLGAAELPPEVVGEPGAEEGPLALDRVLPVGGWTLRRVLAQQESLALQVLSLRGGDFDADTLRIPPRTGARTAARAVAADARRSAGSRGAAADRRRGRRRARSGRARRRALRRPVDLRRPDARRGIPGASRAGGARAARGRRVGLRRGGPNDASNHRDRRRRALARQPDGPSPTRSGPVGQNGAMIHDLHRRTSRLSFVQSLALVAPLTGAGVAPDSGQPGGATPLKVFVLAGQSNMQGHAHVRTLDVLGLDEVTAPLLAELVDADGAPRVFEDVWISSIGSAEQEQVGKLTVGFGAAPSKIGPELAFGVTLRRLLGEPILIIKTAWGGKSLHTDFRPPGAGAYEFGADQLARFEEQGKDVEAILAEKAAATGRYYRQMIEHVRKVLADVERASSPYGEAQGYELAGFVWFQGWNDMVDRGTYPQRDEPGGYDDYRRVLAQFIHDVRKDLDAPDLPFVIGVLGVGGPVRLYGPEQQRYAGIHQNFRDAMAAPALLPEFDGSVTAVLTEAYWDLEVSELLRRERELAPALKRIDEQREAGQLSPDEAQSARAELRNATFARRELTLLEDGVSNAEYHYLGSAKILSRIGQAFAEAMFALVQHDER